MEPEGSSQSSQKRDISLSSARQTQSTPSNPISFNEILNTL
jgi:hypothetical protein